MPTRIFRWVDSGFRKTEEVIDIPAPSRDRRDLELNRTVVDRIWFDEQGNEHREWVGTPEAIAACARVNPLSAALFARAERVRINRAREFEWHRKTDGAKLNERE